MPKSQPFADIESKFQSMFVPSYAPPPIEIPNNVAQERYSVRLQFVRRVLNYFAGSAAFIIAISKIPIEIPLSSTIASTLSILIAMSLTRRLVRGRRMDVVVSAGMLLPLLISMGAMVRGLEAIGWPVWLFALSIGFIWVYGTLCRQDLSFIAMFALPALAILIVWIAAGYLEIAQGAVRFYGPLLNIGFIFYIVYDLSALLTRRRLGEELGANADLFRDILNFTTYWARVRSHWRRHPIWQR